MNWRLIIMVFAILVICWNATKSNYRKPKQRRCKDCKFYRKAKYTMRIDYYYACSIKNAVGPCVTTKEYYQRKPWRIFAAK